LISAKSKKRKNTIKRPFEIDEDVTEAVPSIPDQSHTEDGAKQSLMAYPALKKIQETYKDKPAAPNRSPPNSKNHERTYNDKMEIE